LLYKTIVTAVPCSTTTVLTAEHSSANSSINSCALFHNNSITVMLCSRAAILPALPCSVFVKSISSFMTTVL
jgi:hypothetical protein